MKKLKLNLDELEVESFSTTPEDGEQENGTVFGYISFLNLCDPTFPQSCGCPSENTCNVSCNGTCGSCNGTCYGSCNGTCRDCETFAGLCTPLIPC